jgi:glycosyltransferase involved in cell wall biosynthesis
MDDYSLVIAYADPAWQERIPLRGSTSLPLIKLGRLASTLTVVPAFLHIPYRRWGRWWGDFARIADDLLQQDCNLWVFPRQDVLGTLFPLPVLASVHDLMHRYEPYFPEASGYGRSRYRDAYLRDLCQHARGILVDSEMGKQHVRESYATPEDRLFVLPYIPPAYLSEANVSAGMDKYHLPSKYIFYPAQFWEHKNHVRLINAVAEVRNDLPDIRLVLVGSQKNGYRAVCREVEKLGLQGHILFAGYVPDHDMAEFYRRAQGLVLPTLFGPTNIPPLEAFVLGCPVAVSSIYGMPEQVGDAGLLFDPYSVEDIANSIRRLWSDDDMCNKLRLQGKQRAAAWGPEQFACALHRIVHQLTSGRA